MEIIKDIKVCEEIWKKYTPNKLLWDEWEIIKAIHTPKNKPHFILLDDGLIPLEYNEDLKRYELFGGTLPECRTLWIKTGKDLHKILPSPCKLFDLNKEHVQKLLEIEPNIKELIGETDTRYYLDLEKIKYDFENHLEKFDKKKRKNFKQDLRKTEEYEPEIIWSHEDESEKFMELSQKRFGTESDYTDKENQEELKRFIKKIKEIGLLQTQIIKIKNEIHAISISAYHKNILHVIYAANNHEYKNIGKLMHVENIKYACKLKAKEINFLLGTAWKKDWKLDEEKTQTLIKE